ncbi:MAG: WD40 repeat domain-containing protein [Leptolyngbya sp. SIO1E4]|nr:WD40 repeat domain-containing protein [Leptolyngbya sp. SIO1E4]
MASLKASQQGLTQIKQAIAQKGWKVGSDRWLVEASKVIEPQGDWPESGPYAYGCSAQTWERFLQGTAIRERSFMAFCQVLFINPEDVVESPHPLREDWGEAPDVSTFYGRDQELSTLQQWLFNDHCQLIAIVGLAGIGKTRLVRGGIGKTDLSLHLAHQVRDEFDCLSWRRLLNAPPPEAVLTELIEFVSDNQTTVLADTLDGLITQLLHHLKQRRCLLILDNVESILQGSVGETPLQAGRSGTYRPGYEGYGNFFRRIGETAHQSCLLLTSREKPQDIENMEGGRLVRSLQLGGVDKAAGQAIFQSIANAYDASFQGSEEAWEDLIAFYCGNPLVLEVVARHILKLFDGNLAAFLAQNLRVFGKIRDLLDWHFERFSDAEKEIMYWLTINREAVSISELQEDVLLPFAQKHIPETLDTLERHIPIEKSNKQFTLQPVLIEYMTDRFIKEICQELQTGNLQLFNRHALIKVSAKEYVRNSQIRMILRPISEQVIPILGLENQNCLDNQLSQILSNLQQTYQKRPGYAAGNLLNLMRYGGLDLSGYDFSTLAIWQADLQDVNLHEVNFTACEFDRSRFTQDFGCVYSIAFSPDQTLFAVGDSMAGIRLFRLKDGQPFTYLQGHKEGIVADLSFSPDGKLLASSSMDNTVKLWDVQTGQCVRTLIGHEKWVRTVAFSADGQTVASGGDDDTIRLWHISNGDCRVLEGHTAWIWALSFHPRENLLASGSQDGTIRLWHATTGECCQVLHDHEHAVLSVAFHPNGETLVSGGADHTLHLWDVQTGECLKTLKGHTQEVYATAFNGDGHMIASGSHDQSAKVWNAQTGELLKTLKGHHERVRALAFAPHKNLLATSSENQLIKLWDVDTGDCLKTWHGYNNLVWTIDISPDGQWLASCSQDDFVSLWDLHTRTLTAKLVGHHNWIGAVAFSPDGQILASASYDETIKLWDIKTRQCRNTLYGYAKGGWAAGFSPNNQWLAAGSKSGTVHLWDTTTGEHVRSIAAHSHGHPVWFVAFSADSRTCASCSEDKTIKLWDVETGACCLTITDPTSKVRAIAFHPDGQCLISGGDDHHIKLWDLSTGKLIQTFQGHTDRVLGLCLSPYENILVSAGRDATVRLWDVHTGHSIRILKGHRSAVRGLAFTPDGQTLASSSTDNTIRLWDMETEQTLKVLRSQRPYEGMKIADVQGLTIAQKDMLIALGAIG